MNPPEIRQETAEVVAQSSNLRGGVTGVEERLTGGAAPSRTFVMDRGPAEKVSGTNDLLNRATGARGHCDPRDVRPCG